MQNLRGINGNLLSAFKSSKIYKLIQENPTEVLACIRNNAIGIYYNADRIAMVSLDRNGKLKCSTNHYYLSGVSNSEADKTFLPDEIYDSFELIKTNSDARSTLEKKAQQALIYANNANPKSNWICADIEYRQSTKVQIEVTDKFTGRFDIIAISKVTPHRIAVIELKYNGGAIGGDAGVVKHLKDFQCFNNQYCIGNLKKELKDILNNLGELELLDNPPIDIDVKNDFISEIEFYMIFLYDTVESPRGTVGGYLFNEIHPEWGTKKVSTKNAEKELPLGGDILKKVNFLFKRVSGPTDLDIDDILDINNYEK